MQQVSRVASHDIYPLLGVPPLGGRLKAELRTESISRNSLTEEDGTRPRTMNLDVARCAVSVLGILVMLRSRWFYRADIVSHAVTGQAKLIDSAVPQ